jgi:hypothetical protein
LISANIWYNIAFTISPDAGNTVTNVEVIVSDYANYYIDGFNGVEPGGQGGNSNDFVIGVKKSTPATNPFNSRISLVSIYEGALNSNDILKLWTAYAKCTPKPFSSPGAGRYATY